MIAYKLTDLDGYTRRGEYGATLWLPVGRVVKPTGEGTQPCGPGVLHAYVSAEVAVLANPIHARLVDPRVLRIEADRPWETDGLKRWTRGRCTVLEEVEYPALSTEELIAWSICLAPHESTRAWAVGWLSGRDRSVQALAATVWPAWAVAAEAWAAALAAARAAARWPEEDAEARLMPALARARSILAGETDPEKYDWPYEVPS